MAEDARAAFRPFASAAPARHSTSAAAPSEIDEELAAVTVPPSRKAGFSCGIFSGRALPGCSSVDDGRLALAGFHGHGRDLGGEGAAFDRRERVGQGAERVLSCWSRVNWNASAQSSAKVPIRRPLS
jgi:hypothetical protein